MIPEFVYPMVESRLKELSDLEFQKRIWIRGEGPEVSSYVEAVCQLFDDTSIGDKLDESQDVVFSKELDLLLRDLRSLLHTIDYRMTAEDILNHHSWEKICQISATALQLLQLSKGKGVGL